METLTTFDLIVCLLGIATKIVYDIKRAADKYEDKTTFFNTSKFVKKNVWDFIFYTVAGLGIMTISREIWDNSNVASMIGLDKDGSYTYLLSYISGLFGSFAVAMVFSKVKK